MMKDKTTKHRESTRKMTQLEDRSLYIHNILGRLFWVVGVVFIGIKTHNDKNISYQNMGCCFKYVTSS